MSFNNEDDEDNFIENDIINIEKKNHIISAVSVDICNNEDEAIELLKPSTGWKFPKVKLPIWNPEDEKQVRDIICIL